MIEAGTPPGLASGQPTGVVLVTGMSGAGRSTALKMLEDMGYEAVDNLPLSLLPPLIDVRRRAPQPLAVGIDFRTRDFNVPGLCDELERLVGTHDFDCRLVFLDCDDEVLALRYTETRRRHPLAIDRPVGDGIRLERKLLAPLRQRADIVIDTSALHQPALRRLLAGHFAERDRTSFQLTVTSFAFREGLPREADLVFDVRFLENPYYRAELRDLTGIDPAVARMVLTDPAWQPFFDALTRLIGTLLPSYDREGKSYLTIAIGCTGGKHRSVVAAEQLAAWLRGRDHAVTLSHRDLDPALLKAARAAQADQSADPHNVSNQTETSPGSDRPSALLGGTVG